MCKKKKPEDSGVLVVEGDIKVEQSTVNKRPTINSSPVGAIGFDVEVLEFLDKESKPVKVLVVLGCV